jgi:hypothetical protein
MVGVNTCVRVTCNIQYNRHSNTVHVIRWCAVATIVGTWSHKESHSLIQFGGETLIPIRIHHQSLEIPGEVYGECITLENGTECSEMVRCSSLMVAIQVEGIVLQS